MIDRQRRHQEIIEDLQTLGTTHSSIGKDILSDLWSEYQLGLFSTEECEYIDPDSGEKVKERFERFTDFCQKVIRPYYDPADYFDKFMYVVDRVFRHVHIRYHEEDPILTPNGDAVAVEDLIDAKGWLSKLILISNKIETCNTEEEIESLFTAGFTGGVQEVKEQADKIQNSKIPIRISYIERINGDLFDLEFNGITKEQYDLILNRLGRILDKHLD